MTKFNHSELDFNTMKIQFHNGSDLMDIYKELKEFWYIDDNARKYTFPLTMHSNALNPDDVLYYVVNKPWKEIK